MQNDSNRHIKLLLKRLADQKGVSTLHLQRLIQDREGPLSEREFLHLISETEILLELDQILPDDASITKRQAAEKAIAKERRLLPGAAFIDPVTGILRTDYKKRVLRSADSKNLRPIYLRQRKRLVEHGKRYRPWAVGVHSHKDPETAIEYWVLQTIGGDARYEQARRLDIQFNYGLSKAVIRALVEHFNAL